MTKRMTAALAVVGISGYLLVAGVLDPVLADAITLAQGLHRPGAHHGAAGSAAEAGTDLKVGRVADWQYFDDRPEWSSLRGVPQVSGPAQPGEPTRPAIAPPENPIHFIFSAPPPMPHYSLKPMGACPQPHGPALEEEQFVVTPGTAPGTAMATWWDIADPDVQKYRIVASPGYVNVGNGSRTVVRPKQVITTVTPPTACRQVTVTVTGLVSGATYFFTLESLNQSPTRNLPYEITRGQSKNITIG